MAANFESSAGIATNGRVTQGSETLADKVSKRSDLQPLASHVLNLLGVAFTNRDAEFPRRGCRTLSEQTVVPALPILEEPDDVTALATHVVQRGASTQEELEFIAELALSSVTGALERDVPGAAALARKVLWLECCSRLPLLSYAAARSKREGCRALACGLSAILRVNDDSMGELSRGEQWAALAWLRAAGVAGDLVELANVASPPIPMGATGGESANTLNSNTLRGRIAVAPKGAIVTALSAFSGWLLLRQFFEWTLRLFLGYRANAEVTLSEQGLEIREVRSLLGCQLREQTTVISIQQVKHLRREVRFARAGTYAGLAALGVGSVFGMRLFTDGLRVPGFSLPLLLLGLLIVIGGLGLDFLLTNWFDASKSNCRFLVIAEGGNGLCLAGVEPTRADAILLDLSSRLRKAS